MDLGKERASLGKDAVPEAVTRGAH